MEQATVQRLLRLNYTFYTDLAAAFAATRSSRQINLDKIVTYIPPGVKLLDVGCGNGRLAQRLAQAGIPVEYLGLDFSAELVAIASAQCAAQTHFAVADITQPNWASQWPVSHFDIAALLAVLHHIPSHALRQSVLHQIGTLIRPGGLLLMTNWQFTHHPRLQKKLVPWATVELDERDLEPGDALLDWKRGRIGYRYCHQLTEAEVQQLAAASGLTVREQFTADAGLNLYSILCKLTNAP
jgi:2-polyprenyl-3-methyl-5-hydroxy-6-metoxy-1,4-benzoquinol methylase